MKLSIDGWSILQYCSVQSNQKKSDSNGLIGITYRLFGISQNKHVYGDTYLGASKNRSVIDSEVARSEIYITEGYKFSFRGNVDKVTNLGDNKDEQIIFHFINFLVCNLHFNLLFFLF